MPEVCDSLFHYTDVNAVASILRNRKLWLTNIGFLNDSKEFHDGMSILSRIVEELEVDYEDNDGRRRFQGYLEGIIEANNAFPDRNLYTCSFSKVPNLLSQWRAYGNFAIEFSRAQMELTHAIYDCRYTAEEKEGACRNGIDALFSQKAAFLNGVGEFDITPLRKFMLLISTLKNSHFQAESEVRLIESSDYEMTGVNYRSRGDYLIPYLEKEFDLACIKAIHIGPVANQDLAEISIYSLLRSCGLREIPIVRSDIPFRS